MLLARTPTGGLFMWPGLPHKWWLNSKGEIQRDREPGGNSIVFLTDQQKSCSISSSIFYLLKAHTAAAAAKLLQSCPTLCDPRDGSLPGSPVPGILQARTLEWVAISLSNAWKWKVKVKPLNRVRLLATPWTAAHQAPPYMGFSRQEYWSGVPLPSPKSTY